jgi:HD-like signal output (HDOD) protein
MHPVAASAPLPTASSARAVDAAVAARIGADEVPVPLLPQIASQVLQLAGDPNSDAAKLSALIHRDPSLAGQVLKVANSPAYQPRMPIVSLQQAVARLGQQTLTEIALAASLGSGVFKVPGFEMELRAMWRFAVATSAWAKEVARARKLNVESAFLCGLLHDMGRPVVLQLALGEAKRLEANPATQAVRAEILATAEAHGAAVVVKVAESWKLPEAVRGGIAHFRRPEQAGGFVKEAAITAAARYLAEDLLTPPGGAPEVPSEAPPVHPAFGLLNLYRDEVEALRKKADAVRGMVDALTG